MLGQQHLSRIFFISKLQPDFFILHSFHFPEGG